MRIDAISLAHLCRSDARDFPCAHGKKDCGPIGGELEGITVSTGNENGSAPLFFRGGFLSLYRVPRFFGSLR